MPPRSTAPNHRDRLTEEIDAIFEQQPANERPLFPPSPVLGAPAEWTAMRHYLTQTSRATASPVQHQAPAATSATGWHSSDSAAGAIGAPPTKTNAE